MIPDPLIGQRIDNYHIKSKIGEGRYCQMLWIGQLKRRPPQALINQI